MLDIKRIRENPAEVRERLTAGVEVIKLGLYVEADACAIGIGGAVLSELRRLFRFFEAADGARGCSQTLGGGGEPHKRITEEPVHIST